MRSTYNLKRIQKMIKNNAKKLYLKLYPNLSLRRIELEIIKFDKYAELAGITLESSNRHKYLRGWLMRSNLSEKDAGNE